MLCKFEDQNFVIEIILEVHFFRGIFCIVHFTWCCHRDVFGIGYKCTLLKTNGIVVQSFPIVIYFLYIYTDFYIECYRWKIATCVPPLFCFDGELRGKRSLSQVCASRFLFASYRPNFMPCFLFQDDLESLRHSSSRDLAHLATELARTEQERKHLADMVAVLRQSGSNGSDEKAASERRLLEQRLEEAHLHLADIKTSWSDKIASLETQVCWQCLTSRFNFKCFGTIIALCKILW